MYTAFIQDIVDNAVMNKVLLYSYYTNNEIVFSEILKKMLHRYMQHFFKFYIINLLHNVHSIHRYVKHQKLMEKQ
jgi:putative flippase GtrA